MSEPLEEVIIFRWKEGSTFLASGWPEDEGATWNPTVKIYDDESGEVTTEQ